MLKLEVCNVIAENMLGLGTYNLNVKVVDNKVLFISVKYSVFYGPSDKIIIIKVNNNVLVRFLIVYLTLSFY